MAFGFGRRSISFGWFDELQAVTMEMVSNSLRSKARQLVDKQTFEKLRR